MSIPPPLPSKPGTQKPLQVFNNTRTPTTHAVWPAKRNTSPCVVFRPKFSSFADVGNNNESDVEDTERSSTVTCLENNTTCTERNKGHVETVLDGKTGLLDRKAKMAIIVQFWVPFCVCLVMSLITPHSAQNHVHTYVFQSTGARQVASCAVVAASAILPPPFMLAWQWNSVQGVCKITTHIALAMGCQDKNSLAVTVLFDVCMGLLILVFFYHSYAKSLHHRLTAFWMLSCSVFWVLLKGSAQYGAYTNNHIDFIFLLSSLLMLIAI